MLMLNLLANSALLAANPRSTALPALFPKTSADINAALAWRFLYIFTIAKSECNETTDEPDNLTHVFAKYMHERVYVFWLARL